MAGARPPTRERPAGSTAGAWAGSPAELELAADGSVVADDAGGDPRPIADEQRREPAGRARRDRHDAGRDPDEPGNGVEEAVALAPQKRRLEDRPVEFAFRDEALSSSLRRRVVEVRVVDDTEGALVDEPANPGDASSGDDVARSLGIHEPEVGAAIPVPGDRREMEHGIDALN